MQVEKNVSSGMIEHNKKAGVRHCDKLRENQIPMKKRENGEESK